MSEATPLSAQLGSALALAARASAADSGLLLEAGAGGRAMVVAQWPEARLADGVTIPTDALALFHGDSPRPTGATQLPAVLHSACAGRPQHLWVSPELGPEGGRCRLLLAWQASPPAAPALSAACDTLAAVLHGAARPPAPLSPSALLLAVLGAIPYGIAFVDDGARRVVLSPPAAELLGSAGHDLSPAAFADLMRDFIGAADNAEEARRDLALDGADPGPRSGELRTGSQRWFIEHRPVQLEQASGRVWLVSDVTHERLRERQLREASRMELVTRITGGVAHEFNNLLMRITASADLLLEDALLDERGRGYLEAILRASEHGADLVRRLLTYSRRRVMVAQRLDPVTTLGDILALVRSNLPRHVRLQSALPEGAPPVNADPALLETSILALALNAMEAMEEAGTLSVSIETTAAGEVAFTVQDTGIGMEPEVLAQARDPFFSHRRHGFGTGLGLSMADGFARESGGRLTLDSTPGEGTTARLILPPA